MTDHTDTYALAGPRSCVLTYPPDLAPEEVDGVINWFQLITWKLNRAVAPALTLDAITSGTLVGSDRGTVALNAVPPAPKVIVTDDPEADLSAVVEQPPAPGTPHPHVAAKARRLAIARMLADAPATGTAICERFDIPKGSLVGLMTHPWFAKERHRGAPYTLTADGRRALRLDGHDAPEPGPVEVAAKAPEQETITPEVDAPAPALKVVTPPDATGFRLPTRKPAAPQPKPKPGDLDTSARDRARCKLIAEELAKLVVPQAAVVIAVGAGLELDYVERQLERRGEWFARAEGGGGDRWRLTALGRELASEAEAA